MKKYIIGAIIGVGIMVGGYAMAATQGAPGIVFVEHTEGVYKYYDRDANVVCYALYGNGPAISCLKNN